MALEFPEHIAIRPLNVEDVDQVGQLEALGFPPLERASAKTLDYRLTTCPELSSGLFIREFKEFGHGKKDGSSSGSVNPKSVGASLKDDYLPSPKSLILHERLIGHILGTKIYGDYITEEAMECPKLTPEGDVVNEKEDLKKGHIEASKTIGIHSLVIHPDYQKRNLATFLLHDYIQKLSNQDVGEKIAIIAKKELLPFYNRVGFIEKGVSECKHGGEEWYDLHCPLVSEEDFEE